MSKKQYSLMIALALVAGLVGGVISSQFLMGQPAFAGKKASTRKVIEAQRIRIVDEDGVERASFGLTEATTKEMGFPHFPNLSMKDENGVIRLQASVSLFDGGPMIQLIDKDKNPRVILSLNKDNFAQLMVGGGIPPKRCGNTSVIVAGKDVVSINLLDADCNRRAVIGNTFLENQVTGKSRTSPISSSVLFGEDGKVIWQAP